MSKFFTNYARPPKVRALFPSPSRTLQQFRDEADVNYLVKRYQATGNFYDALSVAQRMKRTPQFGDYSDLGDFREQQERILSVYSAFNALPAETRSKFANNPAYFVEFVSDEKNFDACVEMGIFEKSQKPNTDPLPTEAVQVGDGVALEAPVNNG